MKKLFFFIPCILFFSCNQTIVDENSGIGNENSNTTSTLAWDYPVKPGMKEWEQLRSYEEKVRACQIPEKILSSLSTEDLTEICLLYPLLKNVFAFTSVSMGADKLYNDFNGIRELFRRKEVSKELIKHYNNLIQKFEDIESFPSIWDMELLLGFYTQKADILSKEDYKKVLQSLLFGHEKEILQYNPDFSYPFPYNFYARAHVIIKISPESIEKIPYKDKNGVFDSSLGTDYETMYIINKLSYQLIK